MRSNARHGEKMTKSGVVRLRASGGSGFARSPEGCPRPFPRQPEPAQPQTAVAGYDLRRARQLGPPRAFGGLGPAVHYIRDIARSHTTRIAHTLTLRGRHALNSSGAYCPIIAIYAVVRPGKK